MASTGFQSPGSATGTETSKFYLQTGAATDVGFLKQGGILDFANSVAGYAVRHLTVSFNLNANTQISVAHGCTDSEGNAVTPIFYVPLYSSGDGYFPSQAPDATNIYLTAPAGGTTAVTGEMVVFY